MKVDLDKDGLEMFFKPWQVPLISALLKEDVEMKTAKAHEYVRSKGFDISRASVIFFLRDMEGEGLLLSREESGKGGMHSIYWGTMSLAAFYNHTQMKVDEKVGDALRSLQGKMKK
jgi:hypothetical protein